MDSHRDLDNYWNLTISDPSKKIVRNTYVTYNLLGYHVNVQTNNTT